VPNLVFFFVCALHIDCIWVNAQVANQTRDVNGLRDGGWVKRGYVA